MNGSSGDGNDNGDVDINGDDDPDNGDSKRKTDCYDYINGVGGDIYDDVGADHDVGVDTNGDNCVNCGDGKRPQW